MRPLAALINLVQLPPRRIGARSPTTASRRRSGVARRVTARSGHGVPRTLLVLVLLSLRIPNGVQDRFDACQSHAAIGITDVKVVFERAKFLAVDIDERRKSEEE